MCNKVVTDCFDYIESAGENYFHNFIIIVINCLCKQIKCYLFLVYDVSRDTEELLQAADVSLSVLQGKGLYSNNLTN